MPFRNALQLRKLWQKSRKKTKTKNGKQNNNVNHNLGAMGQHDDRFDRKQRLRAMHMPAGAVAGAGG